MENERIIKNESFTLIAKLNQLGIELNLSPKQLSEYIIKKVNKKGVVK